MTERTALQYARANGGRLFHLIVAPGERKTPALCGATPSGGTRGRWVAFYDATPAARASLRWGICPRCQARHDVRDALGHAGAPRKEGA